METSPCDIAGALIVSPKVFGDSRGYFFETYHQDRYKSVGIDETFVQDNLSFSQKGVLRGLHCQNPHSQGKLVSVTLGEVFDVAVDIRLGSPTFGKWAGVILSAENKRQFWLPAGLAHGFLVLSETAIFTYKCTDFYSPKNEFSLIWNDPDIGIKWPEVDRLEISAKDQVALRLKDISRDLLPRFAK